MYSTNTGKFNNTNPLTVNTRYAQSSGGGLKPAQILPSLLQPLRQWLASLEINHRQLAVGIAKLIPAQCPFEREITLFGRKIAYIPPLCKLNPFYEEFVSLRFRALCYLSDECGEDIRSYC